MKIYSVRVDAVHSEAYKVLGGINRAGIENEQGLAVTLWFYLLSHSESMYRVIEVTCSRVKVSWLLRLVINLGIAKLNGEFVLKSLTM